MNSMVSMECYGVLWSAINHQLVYIDIYRPSLCLYSKLVFPDVVAIVLSSSKVLATVELSLASISLYLSNR